MTITDYYVATDAMGSVTAILDDEGNVLERRSYEAFGEMACMTPNGTPVAESPTGVDVGFQGQVRDQVTGLYQMGYRWYSPSTGRWLSTDSLGLQGGVNSYAFAANLPINMSDKIGLAPENYSNNYSDAIKEPYNVPIRQISQDVLGQVNSRFDVSVEVVAVESSNPLMNCYAVRTKGSLIQKVFIRKTKSERQTQETIRHEAVHFESNKKVWNDMVKKITSLEGKKCCECKIKFGKSTLKSDLHLVASLIIEAAKNQADLEAYEFDQQEYGRLYGDKDLQVKQDKAIQQSSEISASLARAIMAFDKLNCK